MTEPVWLDGTQHLPPQPMLPDPLAGLLTGEVLPGGSPIPIVDVIPPPAPYPVAPAIRAALDEPRRPRVQQQARRPAAPPVAAGQGWQMQPRGSVPAVGYRPPPRPSARPPTRGRANVIGWLVFLFVLFLIARAVISGITGS